MDPLCAYVKKRGECIENSSEQMVESLQVIVDPIMLPDLKPEFVLYCNVASSSFCFASLEQFKVAAGW